MIKHTTRSGSIYPRLLNNTFICHSRPDRESIQIKYNFYVRRYFVYILASCKNGTIYTGVTGDLERRISLHQADLIKGFTKKYGVHDLVHFEEYDNPKDAIAREKQIKKWNRQWKIELIEKDNPDWHDLSEDLNTI